MEDYDAKIAVAMEFYAVRGDLRPFVNERVLKRFKLLLDEKLGDYKYTWEGDATLKLEHRDNMVVKLPGNEISGSVITGNYQELPW